MSIEELLSQLEAERKALKEKYCEYYNKSVEAKKEIERYYEDPFLSPDDIPLKLVEDYANYGMLHTATVHQHNDILRTIISIKKRVGG